jgi:hypothetical protein
MGSHLFAPPSFILGMASIIDFGNTLTEYNYANNGDQADYLALRSDWLAVGNDLRAAVEALRREVAITNGAQGAESQT